MTADPTQEDVLATAGAGAYLGGMSDGTLGQYSFEDMFDMATAAASRPGILGAMMDDGDGAIAMLPPEAIVMQMMDDHSDAAMAMEHEAARLEVQEEETRRERYRRASKEAWSRVRPEELGRMEFDAEQGDTSPMLALEERFYLG